MSAAVIYLFTIKSTTIERAFDEYTICLYFKIIISVFFTTKISTFERAFDDDDDITCRIHLLLLLSLAFYYKKKHHRKSFRLVYNLSCLYFYLKFYCIITNIIQQPPPHSLHPPQHQQQLSQPRQ